MLPSRARFFPNPYGPEDEAAPWDVDRAAALATFGDELLARRILPRLEPPKVDGEEAWDDGAVYTGIAGVAHIFIYRELLGIAAGTSPDGSAQPARERDGRGSRGPKTDTDRAVEILSKSARLVPKGRFASFLEGRSGILALEAVSLARAGRPDDALLRVEKLCNLWDDKVSKLPPSECEVLYGRAGYLYSILFVHKYLGEGHIMSALVQDVVEDIFREGADNRHHSGPLSLTFYWHEKLYLGGAHGVAGILLMLLYARELFPETVPEDKLAPVLATVDELVEIAQLSGNLPSSYGRGKDDMVQWCHGVPALIPLLAVAARHADEARAAVYRKALADGAEITWKRGLLCKGVGICHGIGGNGFALLSAYRATGNERYLQQARLFAEFGKVNFPKLEFVPDTPYSLFEGMGGFVSFIDAISAPQHAFFPGYELF